MVPTIQSDGLLDYCMSDVRIHCLLSDGYGGFVRGANQLGLVLNPEVLPNASSDWTSDSQTSINWSGWSLIIEDLDNDGFRCGSDGWCTTRSRLCQIAGADMAAGLVVGCGWMALLISIIPIRFLNHLGCTEWPVLTLMVWSSRVN